MQPDAFVEDAMRICKAVPQLARLRQEGLLDDVWKQPELSYRDASWSPWGFSPASARPTK